MAAPMPSYSVSVTGKVGPKLLFSVLWRVDLTLAVGELAQQLVDEFSDGESKYVVSSIKVGNSESKVVRIQTCCWLNKAQYCKTWDAWIFVVQAAGYRNFSVYIHTIKHGYKTDVFTVVLFDSVTSLHANMVHTDQIGLRLKKKKKKKKAAHPTLFENFLLLQYNNLFFLALATLCQKKKERKRWFHFMR